MLGEEVAVVDEALDEALDDALDEVLGVVGAMFDVVVGIVGPTIMEVITAVDRILD